jgi:hypothetical protein
MAEDRNYGYPAHHVGFVVKWRPSSGMAEDRNPEYCSISPEADTSGGHPPGWPTFSQAELTAGRVITRCITRDQKGGRGGDGQVSAPAQERTGLGQG